MSTHAPIEVVAIPPVPADAETREEGCPMCGAPALVHRRCKVICRHCHTIVQSCADL